MKFKVATELIDRYITDSIGNICDLGAIKIYISGESLTSKVPGGCSDITYINFFNIFSSEKYDNMEVDLSFAGGKITVTATEIPDIDLNMKVEYTGVNLICYLYDRLLKNDNRVFTVTRYIDHMAQEIIIRGTAYGIIRYIRKSKPYNNFATRIPIIIPGNSDEAVIILTEDCISSDKDDRIWLITEGTKLYQELIGDVESSSQNSIYKVIDSEGNDIAYNEYTHPANILERLIRDRSGVLYLPVKCIESVGEYKYNIHLFTQEDAVKAFKKYEPTKKGSDE